MGLHLKMAEPVWWHLKILVFLAAAHQIFESIRLDLKDNRRQHSHANAECAGVFCQDKTRESAVTDSIRLQL